MRLLKRGCMVKHQGRSQLWHPLTAHNCTPGLCQAYEAAEAGNFQVVQKLQTLFAIPYAEHPEENLGGPMGNLLDSQPLPWRGP